MQKKVRFTPRVEETESGILAVKSEIEIKEPYYVKEEGKNYIVVNENGDVQRVYRADECEDAKACAESFAKKISSQWHK